MKRTNVFVCILVLITVFIAWPAYAGWQASGLQGKEITSLAEDPTATTNWFAGTADGELYTSSTGSAWTLVNTGFPSGAAVLCISIDPATPTTMYAGLAGQGVYVSLTSGATWAASGLETLSVRGIEIDRYNTAILYAATDNGIFKSNDSGVNWQAVTSSAIDSVDIRKITLNPPDLNLSSQQTNTVYSAATGTGGLYKSTDGGSAWSKLDTAGSGVASVKFTTVAVDPTQPDIVYAGTADAGMYRSADGGSTWTAINNGLVNQNILSITFYPYGPTSILVGTAEGGIYRTDTSGDNWYAWNDGNATTKANAVRFLTPQAMSILAGTSDGMASLDNALPDLIVTSVTGTTIGNTGQAYTATVVVTNRGGGNADRFYTGLYLSGDDVIAGDDARIGYALIGGLASGETTTVEITGGVPFNYHGTYNIGAIANDAECAFGYSCVNRVVESNVSNNASAGNQVVVSIPDLIITSVTGTATVGAGQAYTATVAVTNQGGGNADRFYTGLYLSGDDVIAGDDARIGYALIGGLASGETTTVAITGTVPYNYHDGYRIGAIANDADCADGYSCVVRVIESNVSNNARAGNQVVVSIPDLIITSVTGTATVGAGQAYTATVVVMNQGGGNADRFYTGLYLSGDDEIAGDDARIGYALIGGLASGETTTVAITGTVPYNYLGSYYIGAIASDAECVDGYSCVARVAESNVSNNALAGNRITIGPDFIMSAVSNPASGRLGGSITVSNTVMNIGADTTSGSYVGFYLSLDSEAKINTGDIRLDEQRYVSGLAAGASNTESTKVTIRSDVLTGTYYIKAKADDTNLVAEANENNNVLVGNQIRIR